MPVFLPLALMDDALDCVFAVVLGRHLEWLTPLCRVQQLDDSEPGCWPFALLLFSYGPTSQCSLAKALLRACYKVSENTI